MRKKELSYQHISAKWIAIVAAICWAVPVFSQPTITAGLTGVPDTSYTTHSAYTSTRKTHPDVSMAMAVESDSIHESKGITYYRTGSRSLVLDVFQPSAKTEHLRTAVIMLHGGGWRSGSRTQHYALAQQLALRGYTCITPEYRLSTEALFPAALHDVKQVIQWVRANAGSYRIDTSRIVIAGFSAGGQLAALAGTTGDMPLLDPQDKKYSTRVHAIIDIDGTLSFVHPESGESGDGKKIPAAAYWLGYQKTDNIVLWEAASPLSYARYSPPILFINSGVDRMHAGRDDFIKVLNERKVYSEVHTFEKSPHSFCLFHPWLLPTVNYMDQFLKKIFRNSNE